MRKINSFISMILLILLIVHSGTGSLKLYGFGKTNGSKLAVIFFGIMCIHIIIGIILSSKTIKNNITCGRWYFKENKAFWIRRISGLIIMLIMFKHFAAFDMKHKSKFNHSTFIMQVIFISAIFIHVLYNIRPLLCSFGISIESKNTKFVLRTVFIILLIMALSSVCIYMVRRRLYGK